MSASGVSGGDLVMLCNILGEIATCADGRDPALHTAAGEARAVILRYVGKHKPALIPVIGEGILTAGTKGNAVAR